MWQALEALATSAAATFAGCQILLSRRDSNSRAVFEHLREIDKRVQEVWQASPDVAQGDLLAYYRGKRSDLTLAARNYLGLLNSIDLLCFATKRNMASKSVSNEYLPTLLGPNLVTLTFLREFQDCCNDNAVYEHLFAHYASFRQRAKDPRLAQGDL